MTDGQTRAAPTIPGSVGFLGVGTLATAMVKGLRKRWPNLDIHLSSRSERLSNELAATDPSIERHTTNASVVEASDIVVLTMRPPQFKEAVSGISFRHDQIILSCLSGIALSELRDRCSPAKVTRALPIPSIERMEGPLVLCPTTPETRALFEGLCDLIEVADEGALTALWPASTFMSSYFAMQAELTRWMTAHGADTFASSCYVRSLFRALAETAIRTESTSLEKLVVEHETPGGLNFRVRNTLERERWFAAIAQAFDETSRLRGADLSVSETS